ncbi:MAG: hypothetical protein IPJ74_16915 [Saprospiraceae bacterium]|nr:hypothetical protein [Saprospiraceae bacterium]
MGTFNNNTNANITINRGSIGINHAMGTFSNAGTIKIGNVANLNSTGVYNEADFQNTADGILEISRTSGSGFYNLASGTLTNGGIITLGKEASISGSGFYNFNEIENQTDATINIDRTSAAIDNQPNTSFNNEGLIAVGANFAVNGPGIYNQAGAEFLNTDGEIRIDRFSSAAIDNRQNATFTTTGLIIVGGIASTSGPGIYNSGGDFTNDGGEIRIDRVSSSGINNAYSSVFVNPNLVFTAGSFSNLNDGIITIGANVATALGGLGIYNESPFDGSAISTFLNEGTISINRTSFGIHNNNHSSFTNAGDITVGDVAMNAGFGGPGITNYGTFMHNAGTIQIDRTATGIHNQTSFSGTATFTNAATIIIGSISDMTLGPGITNYGTFNNNTGGSITIDRVTNTGTSAVWNGFGSNIIFNNNGVLKIGTLANIGNIGITVESQSTFNNLADGEITIERTAKQGIYISSAFNNQGKIDIGLATNIGERGIMMAIGSLKNEGELTIDRASIHGIYQTSGTLENSGKIDIGKTVGVGSWGIYTGFSSPIINNLAGGEINIDRTTMAGLRHDNGTVNNAGKLNIGSLASTGSWGLWNQATFNNTATGEIQINRTTTSGLHNINSTFGNFGKIYIGNLAAVGNEALNNYNVNPGTFRNEACALLEIYAPLDNTATFVNEGLMRVNTTAAHNNPPGFTNNGVIEYAQVNPIPNVTNNDVIIEPVDALCPTDVIQIGGMNSFTIATTWYQDEALTMPAGTYDAMANTFTPAGLSAGTHTLYFEITDDVNTCTKIASIQITIFSMGIMYVDEDATGANDGTSWMDAYNDLQDALAVACSCDGTQIWVADGTYYPDEGIGQTDDDLNSTFNLCPGVSLYGGFQGIASDDNLNDANPTMHKTILSGDLMQNDGDNFSNYADNAQRIVIMSNIGAGVIFDGFIIEGANGNGNAGAFFISGNSSPTIQDCVVRENSANSGGGIYIEGTGSVTVISTAFVGNRAVDRGGAMHISKTTTCINCVFYGNTANEGGAIYAQAQLSLINSTLTGNMATANGGALFNAINTVTIQNSILWGNTPQQIHAYADGFISNVTLNMANTILQGGTGAITSQLDAGGMLIINDQGGNKTDDPLFVNAADPDGADDCWRTCG